MCASLQKNESQPHLDFQISLEQSDTLLWLPLLYLKGQGLLKNNKPYQKKFFYSVGRLNKHEKN